MIRSQAKATESPEANPRPEGARSIAYIEELANGRVISIGDEAEEIFGYPPAEWLGTDLWVTLLHPDDRDRVIEGFIDLSHQADEPFIIEYRMIARDGREVWIRDEAVLVRGSFEQPLCWQGTMHVIPRP
jgi:PAS domain S-box-containing protein